MTRREYGPSEAEFQTSVLDIAQRLRWLRYHALPVLDIHHHWRTAQSGEVGFPDLVLAKAGVILFRELKTDRGATTAGQKMWGAELGDAWAVWRPKDMPLIIATLEGKL